VAISTPVATVPHAALGREGDESDWPLLLPALSQGTGCVHHDYYPAKWDYWREDWVIVPTDRHDRPVLPTRAPTGNRDHWEKTLRLQPAFELVIKRIGYLASHGLSLKMVLSNFLSRHITPSNHVFARCGSSLGRATPCGLSTVVGLTWPWTC
jgi:hypothetical protein